MSESYWEEEANSLEIQLSELHEKYENLEQQKAELIEALRDVRLSTLYGLQCISIEKIEELLKKHGVEI